jgi:nucleotide-binding universal stress UspA family protein
MTSVQRVLFPTDFSACAEAAFEHALDQAYIRGAELHVLHVVEGPDEPAPGWFETLRITPDDIAEQIPLPLEEDPEEPLTFEDELSLDRLGVRLVKAEVQAEAVAPAVLRYVQTHEIDLIVMGTHGRRGLSRLVLGSVAEAVLREAPCPVIGIRHAPRMSAPHPEDTAAVNGVAEDFSRG